jgi:hypothetical protein
MRGCLVLIAMELMNTTGARGFTIGTTVFLVVRAFYPVSEVLQH